MKTTHSLKLALAVAAGLTGVGCHKTQVNDEPKYLTGPEAQKIAMIVDAEVTETLQTVYGDSASPNVIKAEHKDLPCLGVVNIVSYHYGDDEADAAIESCKTDIVHDKNGRLLSSTTVSLHNGPIVTGLTP